MHDISVAILGCGPAGLFAAHAAEKSGYDFVILSKNRKSYMRGAQYLHCPIPDLSGDPFRVTYELWGDVEGYRQKVYGDMSDILVSPETLVGTSDAWDIREAYDKAWDLYHSRIVDVDVADYVGSSGSILDQLVERYSLVISTIPGPILCHRRDAHSFLSKRVWVTEGLKRPAEMGFQDAHNAPRENLVVCSGDPDDWWYRQSRIHGWENTEFPAQHMPNWEGKVHEVVKPISTDCTCYPGIIRMGRYGQWKKGTLSHEAYYETVRQIVNVEQGKMEVCS